MIMVIRIQIQIIMIIFFGGWDLCRSFIPLAPAHSLFLFHFSCLLSFLFFPFLFSVDSQGEDRVLLGETDTETVTETEAEANTRETEIGQTGGVTGTEIMRVNETGEGAVNEKGTLTETRKTAGHPSAQQHQNHQQNQVP